MEAESTRERIKAEADTNSFDLLSEDVLERGAAVSNKWEPTLQKHEVYEGDLEQRLCQLEETERVLEQTLHRLRPGQSQDDSERRTNVRLRRATAYDLVKEVISGDNLLRALVNIADQERALEETLHDLQTIVPRYATGPYAKDEHMRTHTQADGAMHLNGRAHDLGTEAELTTEVEPVITLGDAKVNSSALGANAKTLNSRPE